MHSAFLFHAIKAGPRHGRSSTPASWPSTKTIPADLLEHVEDVIFNRRADATERLVKFADTVKGTATQPGRRPRVARARRRKAARARAGPRRRGVHRAGRRGGAARAAAAARRDRRAADGRHAHRRRPVRRRQDVPAAGREERARHEEGGRVPAAVHEEEEARAKSMVKRQRQGQRS